MATNVTAHTYYAALASAPVAVWENDTLLKLANNALGVDQTAGSWFYDGTYLYLARVGRIECFDERKTIRLRDVVRALRIIFGTTENRMW